MPVSALSSLLQSVPQEFCMMASSLVQRGRENSKPLQLWTEEILKNPPPAECPSNVLVVPESPNTDFMSTVIAELYHVLLLTL